MTAEPPASPPPVRQPAAPSPSPAPSSAAAPAPVHAAGTGPAAILIGPPGAGKSTVGALVAAALAVGFVDTDAVVEAVARKPVADIFIEDGEQAFRALERDAAAAAITGHDGVVSLGGGAVMDPAARQLLAGQPVVYLETGFSEAAKRVGLDKPRPLLLGNPRTALKALLAQRLPVYAGLAWLTVSTDGRAAGDIAAEIAVAVSARQAAQPDRRQLSPTGRQAHDDSGE